MNFNLIENQYVKWEDIEEEFTEKYLFSTISNTELREKFGMTHGEFRRYCNFVKKTHGLKRRPFWKHRMGTTKYYYKTHSGFIILKRDGDKNIYFGFVPTEEIAKNVVELCKQCLWDIDICKLIVSNWRCLY